jgi:hypothetical protein
MLATTFDRVGPYVLVRDDKGLRHALKWSAIAALSDADESAAETIVQLHGGRSFTVCRPLDEILGHFAVGAR